MLGLSGLCQRAAALHFSSALALHSVLVCAALAESAARRFCCRISPGQQRARSAMSGVLMRTATAGAARACCCRLPTALELPSRKACAPQALHRLPAAFCPARQASRLHAASPSLEAPPAPSAVSTLPVTVCGPPLLPLQCSIRLSGVDAQVLTGFLGSGKVGWVWLCCAVSVPGGRRAAAARRPRCSTTSSRCRRTSASWSSRTRRVCGLLAGTHGWLLLTGAS